MVLETGRALPAGEKRRASCHVTAALSKPHFNLGPKARSCFRKLRLMSPDFGPGAVRATPAAALAGRIAAAPDKSISHRSLILGALAEGETRIQGLLESADVLATARAVAQLGAQVERLGDGDWRLRGAQWRSPEAALDLGNSGTGARLLMGAAARFGLRARFIGDESLSSRPMGRVIDPLSRMGARFDAAEGGRLPAILHGADALSAIDYAPPVASAQVKSAILLAGLGAHGETVVREAHATRDHTETMLRHFGAEIGVERHQGALTARLRGPQTLRGAALSVPGDPSSAAFAVAAALIVPGSEVEITGVMTNPARFGLYVTLQDMGARLGVTASGSRAGEALCDLSVRAGGLRGVRVPASRAPSMIDEYPILAVIAAFAEGETMMEGLGELRAKESDRLAATAALLSANGVPVETGADWMRIQGSGGARAPGGGCVQTRHDHRLAMAGLVLGLGSAEAVAVDDVSMIATSYPGFAADLRTLGAVFEPAR